MKKLEERILKDGIVKEGEILKVDSFINHQIDPELFMEMAEEWKRLFADRKINKILTVEASGIGIAVMVGYVFKAPVVFAKKSRSSNISDEVFSARVHSYTHGNDNNIIVSKQYLSPEDRVLIIDDFLATGAAVRGLVDIVEQAGGVVEGVGSIIEKLYQDGASWAESRGIPVRSLARIRSMDAEHGVIFAED